LIPRGVSLVSYYHTITSCIPLILGSVYWLPSPGPQLLILTIKKILPLSLLHKCVVHTEPCYTSALCEHRQNRKGTVPYRRHVVLSQKSEEFLGCFFPQPVPYSKLCSWWKVYRFCMTIFRFSYEVKSEFLRVRLRRESGLSVSCFKS
jgi:hypothetical protein